jgi:hypothetical protein
MMPVEAAGFDTHHALADEARENHGGVDVISVGPAYTSLTPFGQRYSVLANRPTRTGFASPAGTYAGIGRRPMIRSF